MMPEKEQVTFVQQDKETILKHDYRETDVVIDVLADDKCVGSYVLWDGDLSDIDVFMNTVASDVHFSSEELAQEYATVVIHNKVGHWKD